MPGRFAATFLTVALAGLFGQTGIFGPVSARLKAGDFAPDLVFNTILNAPGPAPWDSPSLSGRPTVLMFSPDTSHNLQSVTLWNALIEQFSSKPVQFIWITGEKESSLAPFLAEHPLRGWVLQDLDGATGRAYGLEVPAMVIIGADRRIIGFDDAFVPEADRLNAALEGRIVTHEPRPDELTDFIQSGKVRLEAESPRLPRPDDHKPDFPPSYTLHIAPSQGNNEGNFAGPDFFSLQGYDLKGVLVEIYMNLNRIRIDVPPSLDDGKHYDFSMVLPEPESEEQRRERLRQGVQDYFHITATREERLMDVYVVTLAARQRPPASQAESGSRGSSIGFEVAGAAGDPIVTEPKAVNLSAIRSIFIEGTMEDFCHDLERTLDRPVINETKLDGEYAIHLDASQGGNNDFLDRLRNQFGIVIEPAQRKVEMLVLKPR